jgi:hypothetical protein
MEKWHKKSVFYGKAIEKKFRRLQMKKFLVVATLVAGLVATGCASVNIPVAATSNPVGSKVGVAEGKIFLGAFGSVDAGAQAAAQNGGITQISTVDTRVSQLLGSLVITVTTTVTGE